MVGLNWTGLASMGCGWVELDRPSQYGVEVGLVGLGWIDNSSQYGVEVGLVGLDRQAKPVWG